MTTGNGATGKMNGTVRIVAMVLGTVALLVGWGVALGMLRSKTCENEKAICELKSSCVSREAYTCEVRRIDENLLHIREQLSDILVAVRKRNN